MGKILPQSRLTSPSVHCFDFIFGGEATAEENVEDAAEIAAIIGNLTGPAANTAEVATAIKNFTGSAADEAETIMDILKEVSRFNATCQGDSGGPLFIKGDPAIPNPLHRLCDGCAIALQHCCTVVHHQPHSSVPSGPVQCFAILVTSCTIFHREEVARDFHDHHLSPAAGVAFCKDCHILAPNVTEAPPTNNVRFA